MYALTPKIFFFNSRTLKLKFIIAVKDHDKAGILQAFRKRVRSDLETEFAEACAQVERIAELRLKDMS